TSYSPVVKKVLPAVVSIESRGMVRQVQQIGPVFDPDDFPGLPEEFRRFFEQMNVPRIQPRAVPRVGFGSGFIADPKGVVLTNYHVVAGADQVEVTLQDGRKFFSKEIFRDRQTDLAIVKLQPEEDLPYLELGDSSKVEVGDRVLAVGAPFGLAGSVTHGIISAKGRSLRLNQYEDFLQTDAPINPGNSGGPLVSLDGKVIGINSAIKTRNGTFNGVGMAISSNLARKIMRELLKNGEVKRGYLGVEIADLDPEVAERLGVPGKGGAVVSRIFPGTPAEKSDLRPGDVITEIAGKPVHESKELAAIVEKLPLDQPAQVTVVRDGKVIQVPVTVEQQPEEFGPGYEASAAFGRAPAREPREPRELTLDAVGLTVTDLTPAVARQLGFKDEVRGALITNVEFGSPADQAGLSRNLVVVRVDGKDVGSAAELRDALAKASPEKGALLLVRSPLGGTDFVLLKLPQR
ncbi:MAG TPA: Do family serine endopeptidase, partial [Gemmataceae bacterium]